MPVELIVQTVAQSQKGKEDTKETSDLSPGPHAGSQKKSATQRRANKYATT